MVFHFNDCNGKTRCGLTFHRDPTATAELTTIRTRASYYKAGRERHATTYAAGVSCKNCRALMGTNPRERGDDDGVEYGDPREVL